MASTNKTTHYELSQYVGTDKPTYLTDYNNDMSAIDTGIYNAQTKADSAYSSANTADGKADTAITNAGNAQTDASTALTRIGNLANLNTTEKTNLVGALNEVNGSVNKFNLSTFTTYSGSDITTSNITDHGVTLQTAINSDGTIAKIYGNGWCTLTNQNTNCVFSIQTSLRPSSEITIKGSVIGLGNVNGGNGGEITIKTTGVVDVTIYASPNNISYNIIVPPCIYFIKDFGDNPQA